MTMMKIDIAKAVASVANTAKILQNAHHEHSLAAEPIEIVLQELARLQKLEQAFKTVNHEDLTGYDELYYQGWYDAVEKVERLAK